MGPDLPALLHLVATVFMAGVIVFVQVVHYPLLARVGPGEFSAYQRGHTTLTGWVVGPAMLTEMATALWLVGAVGGEARTAAWAGLALLAIIWISTAVLQVPAHGRLAGGFHPRHHRFLVRSNWIRTVGWTLRVPVALFLAAVPSGPSGP